MGPIWGGFAGSRKLKLLDPQQRISPETISHFLLYRRMVASHGCPGCSEALQNQVLVSSLGRRVC